MASVKNGDKAGTSYFFRDAVDGGEAGKTKGCITVQTGDKRQKINYVIQSEVFPKSDDTASKGA
jgi:hypothetical protein